MENFSKPGVAGIIEMPINGEIHIFIQERFKDDAPQESGLFEIPAGKIREYENIYDCLRREVKEETGLSITEIESEADSIIFEKNGYKVLSYTPFASAQNIQGSYPIMVQTFICKATGDLFEYSNESQNLRWISLDDLQNLIKMDDSKFYPMHVTSLKKYLAFRANGML